MEDRKLVCFPNGQRTVLTLRWSWAHVLLFVLIWSYGFENVGFERAPFKTLLLLGFLVWAVSFYSDVDRRNRDLYRDQVNFSVADIGFLCLYLVLLSGFVFAYVYKLELSLVADQLHHARSSQSQAIAVSDRLIDTLRIDPSFEYKAILRLVNAAVLAILVALLVYLRRSAAWDRSALLIFLLLLLRLGPEYSDIHPPFRLFPLWLSSVLFGLNDFAFRFVSVVALSLLAFVVYRFSDGHLGKLNAFLCGLAIATIPLLAHVGGSVEQSIWVSLTWSYILIALRESTGPPNYVHLLSVISVASLIRAPAFVALVPILLLMGLEYLRRRDFSNTRRYLLHAAPVMVLLPFLWIQAGQGTPATTGDATSLQRIAASLNDGFSLRIMYYNVQIPWMAFLPFCVIPKQGQWCKSLLILVFGVAAYYVFYSIRPVLWGVPRYQAELWLPFVILGFFNLLSLLSRARLTNAFLTFGLAALVLSNAVSVARLESSNRPVDAWGDYFDEVKAGNVKIWPEGVYSIRQALQEVRRSGYSANFCKVGRVHETFSEVLSGYSVREMAQVRDRVPVCSRLSTSNLHTLSKDIRLILFVDGLNKDEQISSLLKSGEWKLWKKFHMDAYGSTVVGLVRT